MCKYPYDFEYTGKWNNTYEVFVKLERIYFDFIINPVFVPSKRCWKWSFLYWIKVHIFDDIWNNIGSIADTDGIASN